MNIKQLHTNSYVPYSNEERYAVIESTEDNFYPGVRVENISFPLTISAIQNAIFCCLSEGDTPHKLFSDDSSNPLISFWVEEYDLSLKPLDDIPVIHFKEILLTGINIKENLQQLFDRSVVDNSQFPVSCLIETDEGFISGVNIENLEWATGLCAERVALGKAISYGITEFKTLHLSAKKGEYCSPCGACRQVIAEHLPRKKIYLYHPDDTKSVHFSSDLLPYSFQSSSLNKNTRS